MTLYKGWKPTWTDLQAELERLGREVAAEFVPQVIERARNAFDASKEMEK